MRLENSSAVLCESQTSVCSVMPGIERVSKKDQKQISKHSRKNFILTLNLTDQFQSLHITNSPPYSPPVAVEDLLLEERAVGAEERGGVHVAGEGVEEAHMVRLAAQVDVSVVA